MQNYVAPPALLSFISPTLSLLSLIREFGMVLRLESGSRFFTPIQSYILPEINGISLLRVCDITNTRSIFSQV